MKRIPIKPLIALFICTALFISTSHAQNDRMAGGNLNHNKAPKTKTKMDNDKPDSAIVSKDMMYIEGFGIQRASKDATISKGLYKGSNRDDIYALISLATPYNDTVPVINTIWNDILITAIHMDLTTYKKEPKHGKDLLTLRLQKLIDTGQFDLAEKLYSNIDKAPDHPAMIQQGIIVMMLNNKRPLACLEAKASAEIFPKDDFLKKMITHCSTRKNEEDIKVIKFKQKKFHDLTKFEQAKHIAEQSLKFTFGSWGDVDDLSPFEISALLNTNIEDKTSKAYLYLKSFQYSQKLKKPFHTLLKSITEDEYNDMPSIIQNFTSMDANQPVDGFSALKNTENGKKTYPDYAYIPFATTIAAASPDQSLTPEIALKVFKTFYAAGIEAPLKWKKAAKSLPDSTEKAQILASILIKTKNKTDQQGLIKDINMSLKNTYEWQKISFYEILPIFGISMIEKDRPNQSYEKNIPLTFKHNYANFSHNTLQRIDTLTRQSKRGELLLLSLIMAEKQGQETLSPNNMALMLDHLSKSGFNQLSKNIAINNILNMSKK